MPLIVVAGISPALAEPDTEVPPPPAELGTVDDPCVEAEEAGEACDDSEPDPLARHRHHGWWRHGWWDHDDDDDHDDGDDDDDH